MSTFSIKYDKNITYAIYFVRLFWYNERNKTMAKTKKKIM